MLKPIAGQISYGVVLGGCAGMNHISTFSMFVIVSLGYAAKKMTKVAGTNKDKSLQRLPLSFRSWRCLSWTTGVQKYQNDNVKEIFAS